LHFFEEYKEPFRLFDVLSGLFEVESNRVHAASCKAGGGVTKLPSSSSTTKVVIDSLPTSSSLVSTTTTTRVGRSQFHVQEICCASEIPQIESILRPIVGIELLSINPTVKMVYVDHNVDILSADAIAKALNMQGFGAVVKVNASTLLDQLGGIPMNVFVISSFDMTDIYNNTTEGDTDKISEVIQACLGMPLIEKQVKNIIVNEKEMILSVAHNPYYLTAHGIIEMLNNYMYDVKIVSDGGADGLWALTVNDTPVGTSKHHHHSSTVRITVILSGIFWLISMLSNIGDSWDYLKYVALLSVAFGLPHVAMKAFKTLHRCHFDVNCMMFLAASGALALQDYPESAAVVFLFSISEVLEQRATSRARDALSEIVSSRPEYANVINPITHDIVVLPVDSVVVGTTVSVRTGDKIPCDGEVIEGMSTVDESSLTGESRPITKSAGMNVTGGSINSGNTQLVIRTTATSSDSAVARLIRLLEEAQSNRSETEMVRRIPCCSIYMLFIKFAGHHSHQSCDN
jgi:cation transport ATPase